MNGEHTEHQQGWQVHVVPELESPTRLDKYLGNADSLGLTRTKAAKLIEAGTLLLNGNSPKTKDLLFGGEEIRYLVPQEPESQIQPQNIPLEIVYQDEHLAVINKPAGMVTHPAAGNQTGTLVNSLLYHFTELKDSSHAARPGIVHRLDKDTSGLLLIAKNDYIAGLLQKAMVKREIKREYLALVCGHMPQDIGVVDLPVGRSLKDRTVMVVTSVKSRPAVTHWRVRQRFRSYDLLDVTLDTGRTHQIRVHLAHLNHPVFGDTDYGGRERWHRGVFAPERPLAARLLEIMKRQALHAFRLSFPHPKSGKMIAVESQIPADFQGVLDVLNKEGH